LPPSLRRPRGAGQAGATLAPKAKDTGPRESTKEGPPEPPARGWKPHPEGRRGKLPPFCCVLKVTRSERPGLLCSRLPQGSPKAPPSALQARHTRRGIVPSTAPQSCADTGWRFSLALVVSLLPALPLRGRLSDESTVRADLRKNPTNSRENPALRLRVTVSRSSQAAHASE